MYFLETSIDIVLYDNKEFNCRCMMNSGNPFLIYFDNLRSISVNFTNRSAIAATWKMEGLEMNSENWRTISILILVLVEGDNDRRRCHIDKLPTCEFTITLQYFVNISELLFCNSIWYCMGGSSFNFQCTLVLLPIF